MENGRARSKVARLGVRLRVWPASGSGDSEGEYFGIDSLVEYDWQSALGRFRHSSILPRLRIPVARGRSSLERRACGKTRTFLYERRINAGLMGWKGDMRVIAVTSGVRSSRLASLRCTLLRYFGAVAMLVFIVGAVGMPAGCTASPGAADE